MTIMINNSPNKIEKLTEIFLVCFVIMITNVNALIFIRLYRHNALILNIINQKHIFTVQ